VQAASQTVGAKFRHPHRQQAAHAVLLRMETIRDVLDEEARLPSKFPSIKIDIKSA
jgi:hypothetical protein